MNNQLPEGILLIDKPLKISSFGVISALRRITKVQKIGHCGTLDPLATGLLICLVGKKYTKMSDSFLGQNKSYIAEITLGSSTTTYDAEGQVVDSSTFIPTHEELLFAIEKFQGTTMQMPPQFSAKKVGGVKACDAARAGKTVNLTSSEVNMTITLLSYNYPQVSLRVDCSKGTYIRSLAHDLGSYLTCFGYLSGLRRIRSGSFSIDQAICLEKLKLNPEILSQYLTLK
jgi:tRNA pseudouridine55 synthase